MDVRKEFETIVKTAEKLGTDASKFMDKRIASIIISGNKVIGLNNVSGLKLVPTTFEDGVQVNMEIEEGVEIPLPIHVCTGFVEKKGYQRVIFNIRVKKNARVRFIAHCVFPQAEEFTHNAVSNVIVESGAIMEYYDEHYHSDFGTITLNTTTNAIVESDAVYKNTFHLTKTRVGKLNVIMNLELKENAVGELISKVKGSKDDEVYINEVVHLSGEHARGLAKTVVVGLDESKVNVLNEAYGNAPYSRAHISCEEITKGEKVIVSTTPVLKITNDLAELTHEASIGRVSEKQLETLMAKGLTEEEATDLIIKGLLL
ncbi:MAG: SufD family Fe-S cluster assembly protein [Fervidobacterium sp.]|uniref:SufB/SufD family protein n=1 Tax=Fervidobacterium sp. TaxID=1871331 RepID=UPI0030A27D64